MTRDVWISRHPFLGQVAALHAQLDAVMAAVAIPVAAVPAFDAYLADFDAGLPLLASDRMAIDLTAADAATRQVLEQLAGESPAASAMTAQWRAMAAASAQLPWTSSNGLVRHIGWRVLAQHLSAVIAAFDRWRDEDHWLRNYCPACGAVPSMGQLVGSDPGRLRLLSCGCCRARWRYRRTGCPYCDGQDDHRLAVLAIDGEDGLRIDYCERCGGYLKTYDGQGSESVLLEDWTSLHLDMLARDRGLKRMAASLYEI